MELAEEMTYRVSTRDPLEVGAEAPAGARTYWRVTAASLRGPRINADLSSEGGDWMSVGTDGFWRPDVRLQLETDDGEPILMHYTGLVQQTDDFVAAAEENRETGWEDQYMRLSISFEASAERYRWLNESLFVARGRLLGTGEIEYDVRRVT